MQVDVVQALSNIESVLKRDYGPALLNDLNNLTVTYSLIKKDSEEVEVAGEQLGVRDPIKTGHNIGGVKSAGEGKALPAAKHVPTAVMAAYLKYHYAAIEITGQAISASRRNATAFIKGIQLEMEGMVESVALTMNRMLQGNGSGTLARVNGAFDGNADDYLNLDGPGTLFLTEGMVIGSDANYGIGLPTGDEISAGLTQSTAHTIKVVNNATQCQIADYKGVLLKGTGAAASKKAADDDYLFIYDTEDNEMMGLLGLIDSQAAYDAGSYWFGDSNWYLSTVQTLARATVPYANAVISQNGGALRPITDRLIQRHLDVMRKASGRKNRPQASMVMLCRPDIREAWIDELQADRRYSPDTLKLIGGWSAVGYRNGNQKLPFTVEDDMVANTILFLDLDVLRIYRDDDWHWAQFGRSGIWQQKRDADGAYDAYEAFMKSYQNLGTKSFKRLGALRDIDA